MKDRQERIYSALIDLDIWIPKGRNVSVPRGPETGAGQGMAPKARGGAANQPVAPESQGPAAAIRLSRASHDFGEVGVGEDEYWLLALHNEDEKDGIISDISGLPSEGFSLFEPPTLPFTLAPHGSRIIIVRYAPDLAGHKAAAALAITTNDPHCPVQKVLLTGTGVTAPQQEVRCTFGKGTDSRHRRLSR